MFQVKYTMKFLFDDAYTAKTQNMKFSKITETELRKLHNKIWIMVSKPILQCHKQQYVKIQLPIANY